MARPQHAITQKDPAWILDCLQARDAPHSKQERDDEQVLSGFTDEQNDAALLIGWYDYAQATKQMPVEAQVHQAWYLALHPEKLDPKHASETYQRWFPDLSAKSRSEQKRMLNQAIDTARKDEEIMGDSGTDARPLILGWCKSP